MDPTYPLVPIANLIACALAVIPLFNMVNISLNTGAFIFAIWLFLINFSTAINTIIWSSDAEDRAPVWCDICESTPNSCSSVDLLKTGFKASHLQLLASTGIPACTFVITRKLYKITRFKVPVDNRQQVSCFSEYPIANLIYSDKQKRIELLLELAICVGIPVGVTGLCKYLFIYSTILQLTRNLKTILYNALVIRFMKSWDVFLRNIHQEWACSSLTAGQQYSRLFHSCSIRVSTPSLVQTDDIYHSLTSANNLYIIPAPKGSAQSPW